VRAEVKTVRAIRLVLATTFVGLAAVVPGGAAFAGGEPAPSGFTARVTNPWFPLEPGTTYVYRGMRDGKQARDVVTVTHGTKTIRGARCAVVKDLLYVNGKLHERTTDWYTQDRRGNVWYFGEATAELDDRGRVTTREGSWQPGRNGAKAGIYMPARPTVGYTGRQEFYKGHAEDHFEVLTLRAEVKVPFVSSKHALLTKEWTPLEPDTIDHKYYVRGIGTVREQTVRGGQEWMELVSVRRA
jgi:hypothetical protein